MKKPTYTLNFDQITLADVPVVSGKNASLGQLFNALRPLGVKVVDGFAVTADAYHSLLMHGYLEYKIRLLLSDLDIENVDQLSARAQSVRAVILETAIPEDVASAILAAYESLCERLGREPELAVRSSETAEELPEASFEEITQEKSETLLPPGFNEGSSISKFVG